jgi:23S rRNA (uracil1939-C5)-methyltransferase
MARRRKQRLPQTPIEASVDSLSHDGKGIARINGKTTFIKNALPCEVVKMKYTLKKKDYDEGILDEVIKASEVRIDADCPHYQRCGGCSFQHISSQTQLSLKQDLLIEQLKSIGKVQTDEILSPLSAKAWAYRNKARLSVRYVEKKQSVLVGFREDQNPRFIADIDECLVLNPRIGKQLDKLKQVISSLTGFRHIAQVELAAGDEKIALIFRNLEPLDEQDKQKLIEFAKTNQFMLYLQPKGPDSVFRLWPECGNDWLEYTVDDICYYFHPTDFTQVNASLNRLMVKKTIELLAPQSDETILDLFCGLGNFSLPIARLSKRLIGVEGSQSMVERATMNARLNGIENAQFFAQDLTKPIIGSWGEQTFDKMLIDPPRCGAKEIVTTIEQFNPKTVVYVSCNPATLARDSGILIHEKGYHLTKAGVMDMFPQTAHIESIAVFEKTSK